MRELKPEAKQKLFYAHMSIPYVCLFLIIIILFAYYPKSSPNINILKENNDYNKAITFSTDFLKYVLEGTEADEASLNKMITYNTKNHLSNEPPEAKYFNTVSVDKKVFSKTGLTEFDVEVSATIIPAGGEPKRLTYLIRSLYVHGNFQAMDFPQPVNENARIFTVQTMFDRPFSKNHPIFVLARNFVDAFYTQNASNALGRFVSPHFKESTLKNSPYVKTLIDTVTQKSRGETDVTAMNETSQVKTGFKAHIRIIFKAYMTESSWTWLSVPLTVEWTNQRQWVVYELNNFIPVGKITTHN